MRNPAEQELSRVLRERAASIDVVPDYRVEPDPAVRRGTPRRRMSAAGRPWTVLVSAAAIVAIVVAGIVGARWGMRRDRHSTDRAATCSAATSHRFVTALHDGALPVGDVVLSTAHDGTMLVASERGAITWAVETVSPGGSVARLWTARPGDRLRAVANPSGAINSGWVAFVLERIDGTSVPQVRIADLFHKSLATLTVDAGYRVSADPLSAPIAMSDWVALLETSRTDPRVQELAQYWTDSPLHLVKSRTRTSGVTTLLAVGGNVVSVGKRANGAVFADFDQPEYRPTTLPVAVRDGYAFASDNTTLTWLSTVNGRHNLWQWTPGDPSPTWRALPASVRPVRAADRFAVAAPSTAGGGQKLLDPLTGRVIVLPAGVELVQVSGTTAVLAMKTNAITRYTRIPVQVLDGC